MTSATISEKTKVTLGFAVTLAVILGSAWVGKAELAAGTLKDREQDSKIEVLRETVADQKTRTALLEQRLDSMNSTLQEIRTDVRDLVRASDNNVQTVGGRR